MDTWLPYGRMPQEGNHLAGPGRLAGRQSSLHERSGIPDGTIKSIHKLMDCLIYKTSRTTLQTSLTSSGL